MMTNGNEASPTKFLCRWCQQVEVTPGQSFCEECSTFLNDIGLRDTTQADIKIDELLDQMEKTRDPAAIEALKERIKKLHMSKDQELTERDQAAKTHDDEGGIPSQQFTGTQSSSDKNSKSS